MASIGQVERQVRGLGYQIETKVDTKGVATVTITQDASRYGSKRSFSADSGGSTGPERYGIALAIAADRMLDYEYRGQVKAELGADPTAVGAKPPSS